MSRDYFYFISGLPNLNFEDSKLAYSPEQFRTEALAQLSEADFKLLEILHLPQDMDNLLRLVYKTGKDADPEGLHPDSYWEAYLEFLRRKLDKPDLACPAEFARLPEFLGSILLKLMHQEEMQAQLKTDIELTREFYGWTAKSDNLFIRSWFAYEAHLKNILVAINGRKFNLPYSDYLVGEDELTEKLAKSHAADFGLGKEDELFEALIRIYEQNNLLYREKTYDILRWKWIDNQNFFNYFNIDRILGYYCKLRILSRWLKADPNWGKEVFHDTLSALENSFTFPEDFNIKSVKKH